MIAVPIPVAISSRLRSATASVVNDASSRPVLFSWSELHEYRDFLRLLIWRQLEHRYRQTLLGVGWVVINPLLTMSIFGVIVPYLVAPQRLAEQTGGVPYPLYVYAGLIPWTCFAHAVTRSNTSLMDHAPLLKSLYFPRVMLPLSQVLAALVELAIAGGALAIAMLILRVPPSPTIVLLPLFLILLAVASFGIGLLLGMAHVRYRDVLFVAQYGLQLGLLVTPVWFSLGALPESVRWLVALNPMAAVVQGFRWAVLGVDPPSMTVIAVSGGVAMALLGIGLRYFSRRQEIVADYV